MRTIRSSSLAVFNPTKVMRIGIMFLCLASFMSIGCGPTVRTIAKAAGRGGATAAKAETKQVLSVTAAKPAAHASEDWATKWAKRAGNAKDAYEKGQQLFNRNDSQQDSNGKTRFAQNQRR